MRLGRKQKEVRDRYFSFNEILEKMSYDCADKEKYCKDAFKIIVNMSDEGTIYALKILKSKCPTTFTKVAMDNKDFEGIFKRVGRYILS